MNDASSRRPALRFWAALLGIAAAAVVLRLVVLQTVRPACEEWTPNLTADCVTLWGDPMYVHNQAIYLANGYGFVSGAAVETLGVVVPGAEHPPLPTVLEAGLYELGVEDFDQLRVAYAVIGALATILVGAAARAVTTERRAAPGVVAAGLAAVYPVFWARDAQLGAETVFVPLVAATILACYRYRDRPTLGRAAVVGTAIGLCWLTRGEAVLLLGFVALPLIALRRALAPRARLGHLALVTAVTVALMAPWVVYDQVRFRYPVAVTTSMGATVLLSSCDETFDGPHIGYFAQSCLALAGVGGLADESERNSIFMEAGTGYVRDHLGRLPVVLVHRFGRIWNLYPYQQSWETLALADRHGGTAATMELLAYYPVLALAGGGAVLLRRRRVALAPLVGWAGVVTVTALAFAAVSRYRVGADVAMVVLAGHAVVHVAGRLGATVARRGTGSGSDSESDPDPDPDPEVEVGPREQADGQPTSVT